mmetsp:Transcript_64617/g.120307  ORF Transcript_64617/g.120307 Transcript_64617/m.120307 type:complete len:386 (-) Transcript_64617:26-1183(-)
MLVEGRYKVDSNEPIGTGGWCLVYRAEDTVTGQAVALKTYSPQTLKNVNDDALLARFLKEIKTFERLGLGPPTLASQPYQPISVVVSVIGRQGQELDPRTCLVNLLDYSRDTSTGQAGKAADGKYYTVLELAQGSLSAHIEKSQELVFSDLRSVAVALAEALTWIHACGLCHLDVKPDNLLRFGGSWKLIDLESCQDLGTETIDSGGFTPLYASPELARSTLPASDGGQSCVPTGKMDVWGAGVVLLDVLYGGAALEDTKAGFDAAGLFDEDFSSLTEWYKWLADNAYSMKVMDYLPSTGFGVKVLEEHPDLHSLMQNLLCKDPLKRWSAREFLDHFCEAEAPLVATGEPPASEQHDMPMSSEPKKIPSSSTYPCRCCKRRRVMG